MNNELGLSLGVDVHTYEIFGFLGDVVPFGTAKFIFALHDVAQHDHLLSVPKGREADQQGVHNHATGPQIHFVAISFRILVHRGAKQFGGQITGCAA